MYQLEATNIVKQYANHLALDKVSIRVRRASIFGLLGPNGAGKTTLIRIINGITAPDSGELLMDGRKMKADDVYHIGYLPEERGLYKKMKVGEQALYLARLKGLSRHDALAQLKIWFEKFGIQGWWDKKVAELSKGMAQKIQFIVTIIHQPQLLIFDEPFSGFDPVNAQLITNEILDLRKKGATIIFSTHNMASVEELCDDIALIHQAKCVLSGSVDEVRRSHGENIYELAYRGDTAQVHSAIGHLYEITDMEDAFVSSHESAIKHIRAKALERDTNNRLLSQLLPVVEVIHFHEVIPTMHDIFIKTVGAGTSASHSER